MNAIDIITAAILFTAWSYVLGDVAGWLVSRFFTTKENQK